MQLHTHHFLCVCISIYNIIYIYNNGPALRIYNLKICLAKLSHSSGNRVFRARPRTLVLEYGPMHLEYGPMHLEYGPMHLEYGPMHLEYGHLDLEYAQEVSGCTGSRTAYRSIVRGEKKVRANYWLEGCDIHSHGICVCCIIVWSLYCTGCRQCSTVLHTHATLHIYHMFIFYLHICCLHILSAVWGLSYLSVFFHILSVSSFFFIFYLLVCLSIYVHRCSILPFPISLLHFPFSEFTTLGLKVLVIHSQTTQLAWACALSHSHWKWGEAALLT